MNRGVCERYRGLPRVTVCVWMFALWILSSGTTVPFSNVCSSHQMHAFQRVLRGLGLSSGDTRRGHPAVLCIWSIAGQEKPSVSFIFLVRHFQRAPHWWDRTILYVSGSSVSGGMHPPPPLTPFSICLLIRHVTTLFRERSENGDKAIHCCDGQVIMRTYPLHFSCGGCVELVVRRWVSCERVIAEFTVTRSLLRL